MDNNPQPAQPTDSPQPQPQPEPQSQPLPQYQPAPQLQPQQPPAPKQPNKNLLIIILASVGGLAVIITAILMIVLSAANKPDTSDQNNSENNNSNNSSNNDSSNNDNNDDNNNTQQPTPQEVAINKTITDPELGYKIIVKKAIFDVPFKDSHYAENYKSVAVEITIENNSKYYNSFLSYDLKLIINGQSQTSTEYQFEDYVDSKDIAFIPYSTAQGSASSGWVFFQYDKILKGTLEFTYDRSMKTTTDGETIPAKKFTIPLN